MATSPLAPGQLMVLLVRVHAALGARPASARYSVNSTVLCPPRLPHANRSLGRASNSSTGPLHSLVPGNHFILSSRLSKQIFQDKLTDKLLSNSHFQEKILVVSPTA